MGVWYGVVWVDGLVVFGRCFGWVVGWGSRAVRGRVVGCMNSAPE